MLASHLYSPTLREMPADAEVISQKLMLRAGMLRKVGNGLYTYLPLAWRSLKKIEEIVREELDKIGAQEILLPIIQPAEIWMQTGRWSVYGEEMFRLQDRHERFYCLGPTHEEIITTLVKMDVNSYKQLPLVLFQIQNKYRDEIRPRFGLMRSREFIMKDAYSFDMSEEELDERYHEMYDAYSRIFTRCGLNFRPVEADSGAIGGSGSHEFMAFAQSGEAAVVRCNECDYAANIEIAVPKDVQIDKNAEAKEELKEVDTPDCKTIEEVANYLQISKEKTVKVVAFINGKQIILAVVPGEAEVNDVRLAALFGEVELPLASDDDLRANDLVPGYLSPIGLMQTESLAIIVDPSVMNMSDVICGGNKEDVHFVHANPKRDFTDVRVETIRLLTENDACPHCGGEITIERGIEVGQVFKLGTKYSEALDATFLDANGKAQPLVMGCYGIGVSRTLAAVVEQHFDDNGIIWPVAVAPFHVVIVPANIKNKEVKLCAEEIYDELNAAGIETVLDDRDERAGIKFNDADLIGYPLRITIGRTYQQSGMLELKIRATNEVMNLPRKDILGKVKDLLNKI